jgi:hypothetical protein
MVEEPSRDLENARRAVDQALRDIESLDIEARPEEEYETGVRVLRADYWGIAGATRKRLAEIQFLAGEARDDWEETLRLACDHYRKGLTQGLRVDHWLAGQYLVLRSVVSTARDTDDFGFWWDETLRIAAVALRSGDRYERMWVHSTMADLRLVATADRLPLPMPFAKSSVLTVLEEMVREGGGARRCPAIWPTFRQFWRWSQWWTDRPEWQEEARLGYAYLWPLVEPGLRASRTEG